jgi:hypothetical protein
MRWKVLPSKDKPMAAARSDWSNFAILVFRIRLGLAEPLRRIPLKLT